MYEQKTQSKILEWLMSNGFYARKIIRANKNGTPDILGCTPCGQFFAIEVKYGRNTTDELQKYNLQLINQCKGIAFVAYDLETVIARLGQYVIRDGV